METVVRLEGVVELILERLVELGYFKTRSEAIRAGVMGLGKEYRLMDPQKIEDELAVRKIQSMMAKSAKEKTKFVPFEAALKEYGVSKSDLE